MPCLSCFAACQVSEVRQLRARLAAAEQQMAAARAAAAAGSNPAVAQRMQVRLLLDP